MERTFKVGDDVRVINPGSRLFSGQDFANEFGLQHHRDDLRCDRGAHGVVLGAKMNGRQQVVAFRPSSSVSSTMFDGQGLQLVSKRKRQSSSPPRDRFVPGTLMGQLWASRASSGDVRLLPRGSNGVMAHACILEAASPVFAAALQSGMKESAIREIAIPDTDEGVVIGVLQILYTNDMPGDLEMLSALAFIHKYHIAEAARFIAPAVLSKANGDSIADVVRFLRDFDGKDDSEQHFMELIVEKLSGDKRMFTKCLRLL